MEELQMKASLFSGVLYHDEDVYIKCRAELEERFGPLSVETQPTPWESDHYKDELGDPIHRRFLFFENPITQDQIKNIKLQTIRMEAEFSDSGNRRINIDPGYITLAKLVLATTKDYAHRIYLGEGIFAEVTLTFKDGIFEPNGFTYNDYASLKSRVLFTDIRNKVKESL
jgi:hypothetical protein